MKKSVIEEKIKKGIIVVCGNCNKKMRKLKAWKTLNEPKLEWLCGDCFEKWCKGDIGTK